MPIHLPSTSRRGFLAASLATGAGLLLPRHLAADEPPQDPNHFVLLSDTHVGQRRDEVRNDVNSVELFEQARRDILSLPFRPAGAIVSGDCATHHGRPGDYAMFGELIAPLRQAGMSMHLALGNHDNRENFLAAFPWAKSLAADGAGGLGKYVSVWETPHANWFLLDSLDKTTGHLGLLGETQLAWLARALDARPDKPAMVVAHHHLEPGIQCNGVRDTGAFLKTLALRKQVKAYFFGHTHWWGVGQIMGIHLINVPTTAWLFGQKTQPRGFVTARLRPDGVALMLHATDHKHPKHKEEIDLKWRT